MGLEGGGVSCFVVNQEGLCGRAKGIQDGAEGYVQHLAGRELLQQAGQFCVAERAFFRDLVQSGIQEVRFAIILEALPG